LTRNQNPIRKTKNIIHVLFREKIQKPTSMLFLMKTGNQMLKMGKSANHNDHEIKKWKFFSHKNDLKKR